MQPAGEEERFLGGFVAAEGCFSRSGERRFRFSIAVAASDSGMCRVARDLLQAGSIYRQPRRRPSYEDESIFVVQSLRELATRVVPFMDEHLPPSHKRDQYLVWREALLDYWKHTARRSRLCSVRGCSRRMRAKGLCRHHYFRRYAR